MSPDFIQIAAAVVLFVLLGLVALAHLRRPAP